MLSRHKYRLVCLSITAIAIVPTTAAATGSFVFPYDYIVIAIVAPILPVAWSVGWYIDSLEQQSIPPRWFFIHKRGLENFRVLLLLIGCIDLILGRWVPAVLVANAAIWILIPIMLILNRVSDVQKSWSSNTGTPNSALPQRP